MKRDPGEINENESRREIEATSVVETVADVETLLDSLARCLIVWLFVVQVFLFLLNNIKYSGARLVTHSVGQVANTHPVVE